MTHIFYFIAFLIFMIMLKRLHMLKMIRLWEFQNGKMGIYRQKINQDTVKNVKDQIFQNLNFYIFYCILVNLLPI